MPQIMDEKRIDDKHLDLEEKLYGAALMGLPCNKVDPVNFWYVDTKKHAPYQYPQPKGVTIPGKSLGLGKRVVGRRGVRQGRHSRG